MPWGGLTLFAGRRSPALSTIPFSSREWLECLRPSLMNVQEILRKFLKNYSLRFKAAKGSSGGVDEMPMSKLYSRKFLQTIFSKPMKFLFKRNWCNSFFKGNRILNSATPLTPLSGRVPCDTCVMLQIFKSRNFWEWPFIRKNCKRLCLVKISCYTVP